MWLVVSVRGGKWGSGLGRRGILIQGRERGRDEGVVERAVLVVKEGMSILLGKEWDEGGSIETCELRL